MIHRDLKPSNVLVAEVDGKPAPKVIDFGVAKAAGDPLTDRTATGVGGVVGTLEYMSPEQAGLGGRDVDTRSDVYSLGVILYELLTGATPLDRARDASLLEVLRAIREDDPPKPSTRLGDSGAALAGIAASRGTDPGRLAGAVRGELDWVVMKALEKDPGRRYETAAAFAADVDHYLRNEPVAAGPPSARYRVRKFVRRNRGAVLAAGLVAGAVLLGTAGTTAGLVWAVGQRDRARGAEQLATARLAAVTAERERATAAEGNAREEAATAEAVSDFLQHDLLGQARPEHSPRASRVTVEEVLGRAAARIPGKFDRQPRVEAGVRQAIGRAYLKLGNSPAARPHLERALELNRRVRGDEHVETLAALSDLAALYKDEGQYARAEAILVALLDVDRRVRGAEDRDTVGTMNNLAGVYVAQGQYARAEPLLLRAVEIGRRVPGDENPDTLVATGNLADVYLRLNEYAKAEALFLRTLDVGRRVLGEDHPALLVARANLASLYQARGQYDRAEPLLVRALEGHRRVLGADHPHTLTTMQILAVLYRHQKRYAEAEPLYAESLAANRRVLGAEHPHTLIGMNNLAVLYRAQGEYAKAEPLLVRAVGVGRRVLGADSPLTLGFLDGLALTLLKQREAAAAEPLLRECLAARERKTPDDWQTYRTRSMLGAALLGRKRYAEAEPLLTGGYDGLKEREAKVPAPNRVGLTEGAEWLVQLYEETGDEEMAAAWRKKVPAAEGPPAPK